MTRPDDQQTAQLPPMKWNAWGDPAEAKPLSEGIRSLLKQALGLDDSTTAELEAEQVRLRPSALSEADRDALAAIVGAEYFGVEDRARLLRAGGKSTLDLLRRKDSGVQDAPDAVLLLRAKLERATFAAARRYSPGHFPGRVSLFLPSKEWVFSGNQPLQWRSVAHHAEEYFGPDGCNSDTMLREPFASAFAELFEQCCARNAK